MQGFVDRIRGIPNIREIAFLFALLLLLGAWKFGIEGLGD